MKTRARKTRIQVTVTPEALEWLEAEAALRGLSVSAAIEQLVRTRMIAANPPDGKPASLEREVS
jgi:hypothetical protein